MKHAVILEDNLNVSKLVKEVLELEYPEATIRCFDKLEDYLEAKPKADVFFIDCELLDAELCRSGKVDSLFAESPVVIITGDPAIEQSCFSKRVVLCKKPFKVTQLLKATSDALFLEKEKEKETSR